MGQSRGWNFQVDTVRGGGGQVPPLSGGYCSIIVRKGSFACGGISKEKVRERVVDREAANGKERGDACVLPEGASNITSRAPDGGETREKKEYL